MATWWTGSRLPCPKLALGRLSGLLQCTGFARRVLDLDIQTPSLAKG
jgi:hypothetical protein